MARARGANARLALAFESTYGVSPTTGYRLYSFASTSLGEEAPLIDGELLGQGREPGEPTRDASTDEGDLVVPVCARQFGIWLKAILGEPTTTTGKAASGSITYAAKPANNATLTLGGQAFTFSTTASTAGQIKIGDTLAETLANAVRTINASAGDATAASYRLNDRGTAIIAEHKTIGVAGNSFTLAASVGTVSGASLAGGSATGSYRHTYQSGAAQLPSLSVEVANPEVPSFGLNFGTVGGSMSIQLQRGGNLTASIGVVAQGEDRTAATQLTAAPAAELPLMRLASASASVTRNGVPIADLTGAQISINNDLDAVPGIRSDGRITGVDAGGFSLTLSLNVRFSTPDLQQLAENGEPCEIDIIWQHPGSGMKLRFVAHRVFLPKAKMPITGKAGIQADYNCIASKDPVLGRALTVTLDNDQPAAAYQNVA